MSLDLQPMPVRAACDEVRILHRHLPRVIGGLFACALWADGRRVAVAIASLPKARQSCDGFTIEIARLASDGHENACSRLYGALCRAAAAIGYRRAITFTRLDEPGTSLRAAGFREDQITREQSWDRPSRSRSAEPSQVRRWVRDLQEPRKARLMARRAAA